MAKAPEVKVEDVTKVVYSDVRKGRQTIVSDLSVVFRSGKSTALLGHNGAGKTTSIKLILGLVRPTRGKVMIDGEAVGPEQRRRIGYMPEVNRIPLVLNPLEVLRFHLAAYNPPHLTKGKGAIDSLIEPALRRVDLWEHRLKRVGKLSKGMARRLAWAQATIHDPDLLILDEPMSGLDPVGRMAMRDWIQEYRKSEKTIILCSHELATVGELCEEVNVLRKGQLVYSSGSAVAEGNVAAKGAYQISLSGVDEKTLQLLRSKQGLPAWSALHHHGFLARMVLPGYAEAAAWMQAALAQSLLVTEFGPAPLIDPDDLLKFFAKEY
ncbi:MAG: hypothetical protein RIQ81_577 [Pseudomonadota bacterium]|jgi:ABC-2 type transport system ATP-binding protein